MRGNERDKDSHKVGREGGTKNMLILNLLKGLFDKLTPLQAWTVSLFLLFLVFAHTVKEDLERLIIAYSEDIRSIETTPEQAVVVHQLLKNLASNTGSEASCMFRYVPIDNIKTKSMVGTYQKEGVFVLQPKKYVNIPLTVDPFEFIAMKNTDLYRFGIEDMQGSPVWGNLVEAGVMEIYSYPITTDKRLYGHISIFYVGQQSNISRQFIRSNLATTASSIIEFLKLK